MKLANEFEVAAPLDATWRALLVVPRVARALPGAAIEPEPRDGAYRGTMKVRLGAVTMEYVGTARLDDIDEDERLASFHVQARERRGQGTAVATITCRLSERDGLTHVSVETELDVTGRQAQFGRRIMEDVAAGVLERFARGLEQELAAGDTGGAAAPAAESGADVLHLGSAVARPLRARAAWVGAGTALGIAIGWALGKR